MGTPVETDSQQVDLTPSEAMQQAARTGLDALNDGLGAGGVQNFIRARARRIAAGNSLTPAGVRRIHDFFSRYSDARSKGLDHGTTLHTAWYLHGGDAAKAWSAAKLKELTSSGVALSDDDSDDEQTVVVKEMFLASPVVEEDAEGLIWKPIIHEGVWVNPNGGAPLKVVAGHSSDPRKAVGMADLVDAFNDGAVQHVTVPKTHEDKVDENTGYVKKVKLAVVNGVKTLLGGHEFTEPDIKEKVKRGSIPNSSGGIRFNHQVREADGTVKRYPAVLLHNALTPRPWLSRLAPFGVNASESEENFAVEGLEFSEPLASDDVIGDDFRLSEWDNAITLDEVRELLAAALPEGCDLTDVAYDRALVKSGDDDFMMEFSLQDGEVSVAERGEWVQQVTAAPPEIDSTSQVTTTLPPVNTPPRKESVVADRTAEEKAELTEFLGEDFEDQINLAAADPEYAATVTKMKAKGLSQAQAEAFATGMIAKRKAASANLSDDKKPEVKLSELPEWKKLQDDLARTRADNDQLKADKRERDADEYVEMLSGIGLSEKNGCTAFLKEVRSAMVADEGDAVILLSEDGVDQPTPYTASGLLKRIFDKLPTDEKTGRLKIDLSEQASDPLRTSHKLRPPNEPDDGVKLSEEEFEKQQAAVFEQLWGKKLPATPAPTNGNAAA